MKILFVSAEVGPYVSVGGLSQVMYFLPRALMAAGHDVHIITPQYGTMITKTPNGKPLKLQKEIEDLRVPNHHCVTEDVPERDYLPCKINKRRGTKTEPTVHFIENKEYFHLRANVFGYKDDHTRFALLSKACLEWLRVMKKPTKSGKSGWFPDVIHCHDWHTGYVMPLARRDERYKDLLISTPIVYTIHNLKFQGNMDFRYLPSGEQDDKHTPLLPLLASKLLYQNALLRGVYYADSVNTVSPTHAIEMLTPQYGEGLDQDLQDLRGKITGILNGIDTQEFNPATDTIIKKNYTDKTAKGARAINKQDLQKQFALPQKKQAFVIAISGRIGGQKGWELIIRALPHLLSYDLDIQVIVLGDGEETYKQQLRALQQVYPLQLGLHLRPNFRLPRKLFAGADVVLMPSNFEPGGIVALEALRYGAVPLVRRTGGLSDIVQPFDAKTQKGNGFTFDQKDPWVLFGKIIEAYTFYRQPAVWKRLVQNCMHCDFSWNHVAREYEDLYRDTITERKRAIMASPHPAYTIK